MTPDEIEGGLAFADYGLDSILAVRLVHVLNEELGTDLSTDVVFDHSSADRLAAHLLAEYGPAAAPAPVPPPPAPPAPGPAPTRGVITAARPATADGPVPAGPPTGPEPIAVIGMSGRFAGSDSLDALWTHLANGDDLITEATRWDLPATGPDGSARCTQGDSSTASTGSTRSSSESRASRPPSWTPSSGCSWKRRGRPWRTRATPDGNSAGPAAGCTRAAGTATTTSWSGRTVRPRPSGGTWHP